MAKQKQKLELTWIGKDEEVKLEPRILIEDPAKSYGDPTSENMLIHGDNLLALKALEQDFAGKIKCIYIDPPYNTGSAFELYDDNLEHSIWLNLMKPRLEVLKNLLSPDGLIFVQIGFDEMAYLKVLMDEVYGRNNCLGQIAVRMSHSAGMKRKAADKRLIKNTEYILVYYRRVPPEIKPVYEECSDYPVNYYQYITTVPSGTDKGMYTSLIDVVFENFSEIFSTFNLKRSNKSIHQLFSLSSDFREWVFNNASKICRKDSNVPQIPDALVQDLEDNELRVLNTQAEEYFVGKSSNGSTYQVYSLEEKLKEISIINEDGEIETKKALTNLLGDWWDGFYKDMSRVDVEGGVKMKTSKKPERLVSRVFELSTNEGDFVLDSFLGSGTTAAVAHKMNRRWIGIELGEHANTHALPRLKNVVDGQDITGVSRTLKKSTGLTGFKFYNLAPSLLKQDSYGNWVIDEKYNATMLAHAVCKHEGFRFEPHAEMYWKQGKSTETDFIFVTTNFVTVEQLDVIHGEMLPGESLLICAKSFAAECESKYPNITTKKIPKMILGKCEFGKENYDLNIIEKTEEVAEEQSDNN